MRRGLEIARRIGNRHGEMFALLAIGSTMTTAGRYTEAADIPAQALEQARALNARRFEAAILGNCAELALGQGNRREALALVREGLAASEETSPGFVGPYLYGLLGLIETERSAREAALAAGEALLAKGAVGHNHFGFRRFAIEAALQVRGMGRSGSPRRRARPTDGGGAAPLLRPDRRARPYPRPHGPRNRGRRGRRRASRPSRQGRRGRLPHRCAEGSAAGGVGGASNPGIDVAFASAATARQSAGNFAFGQ